MAIYDAIHSSSGLVSVEFSPVARGNMAFFTFRDAQQRDAFTSWLHSPVVGQHVIAKTQVNGGFTVVTEGKHPPETMLQLLKQRGENVAMHVEKTPFNWWQLRGKLGITGQLMQLTSSFLQVTKSNPAVANSPWVRKGFSVDIGIFAILNLIANFGNMFYGAQKEPDIKRLHYAKELVNDQLLPHLPFNETTLSIDDQRQALRQHALPEKGVVEQFNGFANRHSVRFFELGLRYVAALALVIPFSSKKIGDGWKLLKARDPIGAYKAVRNNRLLELAGLGYILGKTVAWFSKVRDPYDDAPHSWVDRFREDWLFKSGSVIESAAGVAIATQAFKDKRIALGASDGVLKPRRDWLGVVGGSLFAIAYIARLFATFGMKDINVNEIIAHTSDTLAKTSVEQLPQLTADAAATLTEHFADKKMSYGQVYSLLRNDMLQFHPTLMQPTKSQENLTLPPLIAHHPHGELSIKFPTISDNKRSNNFAARVKESRDALAISTERIA